jgi:hypothetical protein
VQDTDPHYRFYNDWGCGYSGEFVFDNPEFTQLKFKAVIEPLSCGIDGRNPPAGALRVAYELEASRPRRRGARSRSRHPLQIGVPR